MLVEVKKCCMLHTGGTKFYELIAFKYGNKSVLIKRWGPIRAVAKGGQQKIEAHMNLTGWSGLDEAREAKMKRDYKDDMLMRANLDKKIAAQYANIEEFKEAVKEHYGDKSTVASVVDMLGLDGSGAAVEVVEEKPKKPEKPEPEVIRSEDWGSW